MYFLASNIIFIIIYLISINILCVKNILTIYKFWINMSNYVVQKLPSNIVNPWQTMEIDYLINKSDTQIITNSIMTEEQLKKSDLLKKIYRTKIYTDASHKKEKSAFGIAVIRNDETKITYNGPVPKYFSQTNNTAELYAIYLSLKLTPDKNIVIYTDSEQSVICFTNHNQTKTCDDVINKSMIKYIILEMSKRDIKRNLNKEADNLSHNGDSIKDGFFNEILYTKIIYSS